MKILILFSALALQILSALGQQAVELHGTYQVMVACHETHHVELAHLVEPGKDKFSGKRHLLALTQEQQALLRPGMRLKVKGVRRSKTTRQITKGEIRRQMFDHMTKRAGVPPECAAMGDIISKLKTGKKANAKAPCGHDHGELELIAADDDDELVEITVQAHIEVTEVAIEKGGTQ